MKLTVVAKVLKLMAIHKGIIIGQYLDDWLVKATSHQVCLQHTQERVKICQVLGWLVNLEKSELEPKAGLRPCRFPGLIGSNLNLTFGRTFRTKYCQYCQYWLVRSSSSCLIGLLTATGKQVHLGPLHRRPIQWHLTNIWRVPELLEMVIPIPRSLHPHLQWWLQEDNVLAG